MAQQLRTQYDDVNGTLFMESEKLKAVLLSCAAPAKCTFVVFRALDVDAALTSDLGVIGPIGKDDISHCALI